jgi:hypothetical protein
MNRPFLAKAQHFIVWRYGHANRWRCSQKEIAEATGVPEKVVRSICHRHGYRPEYEPHGGNFVMPVDSYFRQTATNIRHRY